MTSAPAGAWPGAEALARAFRYRDGGRDACRKLVRAGFRESHCFPHRIVYLPRGGPDGYRIALSEYGLSDPAEMCQVQLYAASELLAGFPRDLFFDDDLIWHQQQLGIPGQVATADIVLHGEDLYSTVRFADLVQRIGRRREHKTHVEKKFGGWNDLLLNAIMNYAVERGAARVHFARSALAMRNTDRKRTVQKELFERIYDRAVTRLFHVKATADTWVADVAENRGRFVKLETAVEPLRVPARIVCIGHDTERGYGHMGIDRAISETPDSVFNGHLEEMLRIEASHGIRTTYNVVGCFLNEVRPAIAAGGHAIAFHSYDHVLDSPQLERCRKIDYRLKGYRPPQSLMTEELSDSNLSWRNFEWLAASSKVLASESPALKNGVVRIPIAFDDFPMHQSGVSWPNWSARALAKIRSSPVAAFCLHDCYAPFWLPGYPRLLDSLAQAGEWTTFDDLAAKVVLSNAL